jgi:DNA-binding beta-propeller fold protein YncE
LLFAPSANGEAVATVDLAGQNAASSFALDPAQKNLYIATTGANALPEIVVIPLPLKNDETTYHTITTSYAPAGAYLFGGISFDASGNLYVTADPQGSDASAVFEFPAGKTGNVTPSRIIEGSSVLSPTGVGVDASGLVYVANYPNLSTNTYGNVTVYKPGSSSPIRTITNSELALPGVSRVGPYVK